MSILHRILLAFSLIITAGAVQSGVTFLQISGLSNRVDQAGALPLLQVDSAWKVSDAFHKAEVALETATAGLHDETQSAMAGRFQQAVEPIRGLLARAFVQNAGIDHADADSLLQQIELWRADASTLLGIVPAASIPAPYVLEKRSKAIHTSLQALIAKSAASAEAARTAIQAEAARAKLFALSFAAVFVALCIAIAVPVARSLSRPLHRLQVRMRAMMEGDMDGPIAGEDRRDEVGAIARALSFMREQLTERQRRENEAAMGRLKDEQTLKDAEAVRATAEQAFVVSSLKSGLQSFAKGNLAHRLTAAFPAGYDQLRTDFNATAVQLQDLIVGIAGSTEALQAGIAAMTQAADQLSERTEQQAASLEETAAALQEVTTAVTKTAKGSQRAHEIVATTQSDAEQSSLVVRDAVAAMAAIEQASRQIGQVVGLIDNIAFQTNLLALNAGVEAARAGDSGRGFAVVASEVRALAQRSANAAKEIKMLIAESDQQVGDGVRLVAKTGDALAAIRGQVTEIAIVVSEIAGAAQDQARTLTEVNTALNHMDQFTRHNAAMVEQSTISSHGLATETDQLSQLTSRFSLSEQRLAA